MDILRRLNEDIEGLWSFKYYGANDIYSEEKGEDKKEYQIGCVEITNKLWPGAINTFSLDHQKHFFIYMGHAQKADF